MQPHFASIKADAARSPVLIQATGSLGVVPGVAIGLSSDGEGVVIELNDDFKGEVVFKNGSPLSPAKPGSRKRHRRSCGANETIEVQIIEDGGRPRSVARVRTADVGGIIGPALAWNGGKEWGERTFDLATDAKTKGFGSAGAPFTQMAGPLCKLVLQKLHSWADDEVEERYEVSDERSGASRTTLALCPSSRRSSSFLSHPPPWRAQICKALHIGKFADFLDRKFSNNILAIRGAFYALRFLFAISKVRRDATTTNPPPPPALPTPPPSPRRARPRPAIANVVARRTRRAVRCRARSCPSSRRWARWPTASTRSTLTPRTSG